jgi:ribosomal protein S18 acetylase RimI-like enzyme
VASAFEEKRTMTVRLKAKDFQFVNRLSAPHIDQLWRLCQGEWWSRGRRLDDVRRAVEHSDLIFAYANCASGRLAGFARVLTDFVYKAVVFDLIVDPQYRDLGLGRALLEAVTAHPALLFVEHIELYCRPELIPFYQRWGFTADLDELCLMRKAQQPLRSSVKARGRLAS